MGNKNPERTYVNILDRIKYFESDISVNEVRRSDFDLKYKSIIAKNQNTSKINQLISGSNNTEDKGKYVADIKKKLCDKMKPDDYKNVSKITYQQEDNFTSKSGQENKLQDIITKLTKKNTSPEVKRTELNKTIDCDHKEIMINPNDCIKDNKIDVRIQKNEDIDKWRNQFHFFDNKQTVDEDDESRPNYNLADPLRRDELISIENDNLNGDYKSKTGQERNDICCANTFVDSKICNNANQNENLTSNKDELIAVSSTDEYDITDVVYDMSCNLDLKKDYYKEIVEKSNNAQGEIDCIVPQNRFLEDVLLPEQDYVAVLKNLLNLYEESKPHYHAETIRHTFGEIVALYKFHTKFYKDLKRCRSIKELGHLFMSRKCSFDIYIRDKWEKSRHSLMTKTIFIPHHNWTESQIIQYEYMLKQLCDYSNEETIKCALRVIKELMQQCEEISWLNTIKNCPVLEIGGKFLSKEEFAVSCGGVHFGISCVILMEEYIICVNLKCKTCFAYKPINAIGISTIEGKKLFIEDIDNGNKSRLILKCSKIEILQEWQNAIDYLVRRLKLKSK